jgi:V/A-type H+-transporting ATPase subunit I
VVLHDTEPQNIPGQRVELDRRPLSELRVRLEEVEDNFEELHHQRVGLTRWCQLLAAALDEADDAAARAHAARQTLNGRDVFALQGWVPREAVDQIHRFVEENNLAVTIERPKPDDEPPTLLHNTEQLAGGEALVTFYKTPEYHSWDPSIVAYFSFAVFFAMILADAGYGAILAVLTAYLWKKMGTSQGGRRGRNVLATIVAFTIVYGVLCGSYFGVSPSSDSPLGRLQILDAQSQELMMPLTIVIGVIHLSLANLVMAWSQRGRTTALASLGWVVVMAGATSAGIGTFADVSVEAAERLMRGGTILLIGGLVAVFLFSSQRPLLSLSVKNHLLRIMDGLTGLTGLSGLFGDVLSYLRLFALGLSSAKLSETFNGLGASAWDEAGFGVIAAIGIVILGHTLNLLLSIMSGVVHGLRLNCIEFFKWSLPEEGHLFTAFAKKARQP